MTHLNYPPVQATVHPFHMVYTVYLIELLFGFLKVLLVWEWWIFRVHLHQFFNSCNENVEGDSETINQLNDSTLFCQLWVTGLSFHLRENVLSFECIIEWTQITFTVFLCFCYTVLQTLEFEFDGLSSSAFAHQRLAVLLLFYQNTDKVYLSHHRSNCHGLGVVLIGGVFIWHFYTHATAATSPISAHFTFVQLG